MEPENKPEPSNTAEKSKEDLLKELEVEFEAFKEENYKAKELFSKNELNQALEAFSKLNDSLKGMLVKATKNKLYPSPLYSAINTEFVNCSSNRATILTKLNQLERAIEIDNNIVTQLDPRFDKSYVRIIRNFMALNRVTEAKHFFKKFTEIFDPRTVQKHDALVKEYNEFISRHAQVFSKTTTEESKAEKIPANTGVLGWALLGVSAVGLGVLFLFRDKFKA